jgi:uncharacterized protein Smg (DUF494 family)|tara:strand:- start:10527 stop:11363 length:837 start_codon:yes stop_codon:yes gene_type:complete
MKSKTPPRKRGQLSLEEEQYIRDHVAILPVQQIADNLNRTIKPVERYISESKIGLKSKDEQENDTTLRQKLHAKTFWIEITKQFDKSTGELQYFEDTWIGLVKQFREDVLPAEELQIKQFITIDILINRSMKERKRHISDTEKLQEEVDNEYKLPEDARDAAKLANLETQLSFARNSIANYTNEYTKLLNEQQKISKDLKATREQRIKRIEDGKSSWIGLIRMLEDEEIREKEGREMEIMAMAVDKNKKLLAEYHNYADDTVDSPLLTPETIVEKDKE